MISHNRLRVGLFIGGLCLFGLWLFTKRDKPQNLQSDPALLESSTSTKPSLSTSTATSDSKSSTSGFTSDSTSGSAPLTPLSVPVHTSTVPSKSVNHRSSMSPKTVSTSFKHSTSVEILRFVMTAGAQVNDTEIKQASQQLHHDPQLADQLRDIVISSTSSNRSRALALDLLTHNDHPRAQRGLIDALQSPKLKHVSARQRSQLYQRVGFVANPSESLVNSMIAMAQSSDGVQRRAMLGSAGGVVRRLSSRPEASATQLELADRLTVQLLLKPQAQPSDEAARLIGLGNTQNATHLMVINAASHSSTPVIKLAATRSLARLGTIAQPRLVELVASGSEAIQRAALIALSRQTHLSVSILTQLARPIAEHKLQPQDHDIAALILGRYTHEAPARDALKSLLSQVTDDPGLRGRIRSMLASIKTH